MNQTALFSIGVVVFAVTIVAAMVVGRHAFCRIYEAQVADARAFAVQNLAAAVAVVAVVADQTSVV